MKIDRQTKRANYARPVSEMYSAPVTLDHAPTIYSQGDTVTCDLYDANERKFFVRMSFEDVDRLAAHVESIRQRRAKEEIAARDRMAEEDQAQSAAKPPASSNPPTPNH